MRLRDYAKEMGVCYKTAWNWYKNNKIDAFKSKSGSIYVNVNKNEKNKNEKIVIYTRVNSSENKSNLETQSERLINYSNAKGYQIHEVIKEIGSGINDNRPKLNKLLLNPPDKIIIEHKDRLTRFGFNYLYILLSNLNCNIEIINNIESNKEDLIQDFISIITSFCARIYEQKRNKRKTEELIKKLREENDSIN